MLYTVLLKNYKNLLGLFGLFGLLGLLITSINTRWSIII